MQCTHSEVLMRSKNECTENFNNTKKFSTTETLSPNSLPRLQASKSCGNLTKKALYLPPLSE